MLVRARRHDPGVRGRGEPGPRHRRLHRRQDERPRDAASCASAAESRSYYLLGYSPGNIPRDGRFRKIEVKVRRPGAVVRARRGYFAPSDVAAPAAAEADEAATDPQIQFGLDAPTAARRDPPAPDRPTCSSRRARAGAHARPGRRRRRRLQGRVHARPSGRLLGTLDTLAVAARRENSEVFRNDQKVDLERKPGPWRARAGTRSCASSSCPPAATRPSWSCATRTSRRLGTVSLEFEVPPARRAPDLEPDPHRHRPGRPGGAPNAVVLARAADVQRAASRSSAASTSTAPRPTRPRACRASWPGTSCGGATAAS